MQMPRLKPPTPRILGPSFVCEGHVVPRLLYPPADAGCTSEGLDTAQARLSPPWLPPPWEPGQIPAKAGWPPLASEPEETKSSAGEKGLSHLHEWLWVKTLYPW